jgi:hypothetical protein
MAYCGKHGIAYDRGSCPKCLRKRLPEMPDEELLEMFSDWKQHFPETLQAAGKELQRRGTPAERVAELNTQWKAQRLEAIPGKISYREAEERRQAGMHLRGMYMVRLAVSRPAYFPNRCVCCRGAAETKRFVFYETTRRTAILPLTYETHRAGYNVPYCKRCADYSRSKRNAIRFAKAAFIPGLLACFDFFDPHDAAAAMLGTFGITLSGLSGLLLGMALLALSGLLLYPLLRYIHRWLHDSFSACCTAGRAIRFIYNHFGFRDEEYAHDFAEQNGLNVEYSFPPEIGPVQRS